MKTFAFQSILLFCLCFYSQVSLSNDGGSNDSEASDISHADLQQIVEDIENRVIHRPNDVNEFIRTYQNLINDLFTTAANLQNVRALNAIYMFQLQIQMNTAAPLIETEQRLTEEQENNDNDLDPEDDFLLNQVRIVNAQRQILRSQSSEPYAGSNAGDWNREEEVRLTDILPPMITNQLTENEAGLELANHRIFFKIFGTTTLIFNLNNPRY